jgi:hypothetical protein
MLHPVGSLPPSVYWRRRAALLGSLVVLIAVTVWTLSHGTSSSPAAAPRSLVPTPPGGLQPAPTSTSSTSRLTITENSGSALVTPTTSAGASGTNGTTRTAANGASNAASNTATNTANAAPTACLPAQLDVSAAVGAASYHVGDQPTVMLQVKNKGPTPCVQDLADSQVELRVYNGESRVWGSHDCQVQPGTDLRTLAVNQPVRVSIIWSGLSSQPNCAGTRQRVGAGTYTLYASLAGHVGAAAQFTIS